MAARPRPWLFQRRCNGSRPLLAARLRLVVSAAGCKSDPASVADPGRVEAVLEGIRGHAETCGAHTLTIELIYRTTIERGISLERDAYEGASGEDRLGIERQQRILLVIDDTTSFSAWVLGGDADWCGAGPRERPRPPRRVAWQYVSDSGARVVVCEPRSAAGWARRHARRARRRQRSGDRTSTSCSQRSSTTRSVRVRRGGDGVLAL